MEDFQAKWSRKSLNKRIFYEVKTHEFWLWIFTLQLSVHFNFRSKFLWKEMAMQWIARMQVRPLICECVTSDAFNGIIECLLLQMSFSTIPNSLLARLNLKSPDWCTIKFFLYWLVFCGFESYQNPNFSCIF